jgi:aspartate/methionine/tyrosine aminotransferase
MFSSRLRETGGRNRFAAAIEGRRAEGRPIVDLTLSNPTRAGLVYPVQMLAPMAQSPSMCYEPAPFGLLSAREAVSDDLARRGLAVPASRIVLTASTSEAYSLLFKLLCDPGDAVVAPRPSYPLIEHLAGLDAVALDFYRLEFHGRWQLDVEDLRDKAALGRMRAIVMISPNNPTGSVATDDELEAVASIARERDLALISDEVFADYPIPDLPPGSALRQETALTFALGGLSKSVGLPQVKLGWIAVSGPAALVADAMERLETICDAYLSVSTPVQLAAPDLLKAGASVRTQIQARVRGNYARLLELGSAYPACNVLPVEGGWYAVLQVPAIASEDTIALGLLDRTGVLVYPGYFFDFEREAYLVLSLLPEPSVFASAAQMILEEAGSPR